MLEMENKYKMKVCFSSGVKYKDIYYLTALHMNALFSYNVKKDKLTYLMSFKQEQKNKFLYLKSFLYKNEAWFFPYQSDYIAIVDLEKLSISYMPLIFKKEYNDVPIKYINLLYFKEDFLCLLPAGVDAIMIIDLKNKKAKAYYEVVDKSIHFNSAVYLDDKIYCFPWKGENLLVLDLKSDEIKFMPWMRMDEAFGDAVYDKKSGNLFHAPAKENYILINNLNGNIYRKIEVSDKKDETYKTYYSTNDQNEIFFWGHEKNIVLKINKYDYRLNTYIVNQNNNERYFYPIYSDKTDDIEAIAFGGNCIIQYDKENDVFLKKIIYTNFDDLLLQIKKIGYNIKEISWNLENEVCEENMEFGIKYLLQCCDKKSESKLKSAMIFGTEIYKGLYS